MSDIQPHILYFTDRKKKRLPEDHEKEREPACECCCKRRMSGEEKRRRHKVKGFKCGPATMEMFQRLEDVLYAE